jgi:hypothetical protein
VTLWLAVLAASAGCFVLKFAGWSVPSTWLERPRVQRGAALLPVALLAALVVVQAFAAGRSLAVEARAAGLVVAAALLLARVPFLLVVVGAAATAAVLRAVAG